MNIRKTIRRILSEEKLHATPQELIRSLPEELKQLLFKQWHAKQNPEWHPEGNTLKHIFVVIKRAYHHYPEDPNMIMAALFHDLGKMDTYKINPKTNQPTAYGHEDKSTDYVEQFKNWIESFEGTDVEEIKYLVKNHMKVKPSTWDQMKEKKKEPIKSHPAFDKLMGFTDKLDGGGTDLKESIRRIIKETLESRWNEGNYDYQYGYCHYFAYDIIGKIKKRFPNKKVNYYLQLAQEIDKYDGTVVQDYLIHVYIKIDDMLLDSNGITTKREASKRAEEWEERQAYLVPETYETVVWEEESDEIPEIFFNNKFCNPKRVKEDVEKFLSHPIVKRILRDK